MSTKLVSKGRPDSTPYSRLPIGGQHAQAFKCTYVYLDQNKQFEGVSVPIPTGMTRSHIIQAMGVTQDPTTKMVRVPVAALIGSTLSQYAEGPVVWGILAPDFGTGELDLIVARKADLTPLAQRFNDEGQLDTI